MTVPQKTNSNSSMDTAPAGNGHLNETTVETDQSESDQTDEIENHNNAVNRANKNGIADSFVVSHSGGHFPETAEDTDEQDDKDSTSFANSRKKLDQQTVQNQIEDCRIHSMVILDLSKKRLRKVPDDLLSLTHLEYLYLEGNEIACLPDNFFDCLPNLQWLDLRNNSLQALPITYIGRHKCLRNLLLEGNELRTIPLELGLVTTINGLNIANNPLEFPPQEVIARGTSTVLLFLREVLKAKSLGRFPVVPKIEDLKVESEENSSDEEWGTSRGSRRRSSQLSNSSQSVKPSSKPGSAIRDFRMQNDELGGPVPLSALLQRRTSYNEVKQQQLGRLKRAGALGALERKVTPKNSGKKLTRLSQYPEPPSADKLEQAYLKERKVARLKDISDKQDLILQRRRDAEALKDWRDESKQKQMKKHREKMVKGKIDFEEPAKTAPFGVDESRMRMETNEERIARDIREKHEKLRKAPSPESLQRLELERRQRDQELQKRLKDHTHQMQERRRRPKGNPQEEMLAAKKELEIAENLQRELQKQREYRFTAFTGDVI